MARKQRLRTNGKSREMPERIPAIQPKGEVSAITTMLRMA
jgi:hypothetical protein